MSVAKNIAEVKERIAIAAKNVGRDSSEITLIAVSKTVTSDVAIEALDAGIFDLGESRVQEARAKAEVLGDRAKLHMIGPLQTNKAKYCPDLFSLVHSIDRLDLIKELNRRAKKAGVVIDGLLQVNISGELAKSGCNPDNAAVLLKEARAFENLRINGLMTIPPNTDTPEESRPYYRNLLLLRDQLRVDLGLGKSELTEISAGMTNDFEVAIEEGATMVRVGTAIFGSRQ